MFDWINKHKKLFNILLFILILPSFVLFGIDQYGKMFSSANATVAEVGGKKITREEWDQRHRQVSDEMRAKNPDIDPAMLDSEQAKYATLERMVQELVVSGAGSKLHLLINDHQLAAALMADPAIAQLRDANGQLDQKRYAEMLAQRHLTPATFEAGLRNELMQRQVFNGVADGLRWVPPSQANLVLNPYFERREIEVFHFNPQNYAAQVKTDEASLQAYYDAHKAQFALPEQATVQYLKLDLPAVMAKITVSDADAHAYYEQNKSKFGQPEQRKASHILIAVPQGAADDVKAAAKQKAEELLAQVKQNPASFAELATKNSQDPGSAKQGGDLGFFPHDMMAKPFADAAFAMKQGDISDVVETSFGYHIIQLTGIKPGNSSFETSRKQVDEAIKKELAQKQFTASAEQLSELTFQNPSTLEPAATKLGLQVQTANGVLRTPPAGAQGVFANKNFLQALFANDSVSKKTNTAVVDLGGNELVVGRIAELHPARQPELKEVVDRVRPAYVQQQAAVLAKAAGEARFKEWQANPAAATGGQVAPVSRAHTANLPENIVDAVMRADASKLPQLVATDIGLNGYVVTKVTKVLPADEAQKKEQLQANGQVAQAVGGASLMAYYETLKKLLNVKILVPKPAAAPTHS